MTEDEIDDLAYGIVEDYLDDGPEYIAVVEATDDNADDPQESDYRLVADRVHEYLVELKRKF